MSEDRKVYLVHGEFTMYGDHVDDRLNGESHIVGVTSDPDEAEVMAETEASRYATFASVQWKRTSRKRWKVWEPREFQYIIDIEERNDDRTEW